MDGKQVILDMLETALKDEAGPIGAFAKLVIDRLEAAEARLEALENVPVVKKALPVAQQESQS